MFWDSRLKFVRPEVDTGRAVPLVYETEIDETGNIPAKYPQGSAELPARRGVPSAAKAFPRSTLRLY